MTRSSRPADTGRAPWAPEAMIDWLMTEGRRCTSGEQLTSALGEQLIAAGVPLLRMRLSLRTLHPQFFGSSYTWWRNRAEVETYSPPHSILNSDDYRGSPIEAVQNSATPFRCRLADKEIDVERLHSSLRTLAREGVTDYLVYPLPLSDDDRPATLILATDHPEGFTDNDLSGFERLALFLSPVLEVLSLQQSARALLDTYLGRRSGQRVFDGQIKRGDGELIEAAIWYSDLRDFTAISETLNHVDLLNLLNHYFEIICNAVRAHGGEVLRFIGDAMLVVFPADQERPLQQACRDALAAAEDAQAEIDRINPQLRALDLPDIRYGLGLDVGEVIYGNVGAPDRLDFTVMGPSVNRAARLEGLTKKTGCPVLASESFAAHLPEAFSHRGEFMVRGVRLPLQVFGLAEAASHSR